MSRIGSYHFDDSNVGVVIPDRNLDGADRNRAVIFDVNSLHSVEFDLIWQGDKLKMCGWMMPLIVRVYMPSNLFETMGSRNSGRAVAFRGDKECRSN